VLDAALGDLGAWDALARADRETRGPDALRAHLHTWFDGFRTLKLIHALRRGGFASVAYREALAAPWSPVSAAAGDAPVDVLRRALADHLADGPARRGVLSMVRPEE
jgi:hypothetical protein